jgi:hypothetical protein
LPAFKHCRRVATRYDKLATNDLAFVQLASMRLWLRVSESTPQSFSDAKIQMRTHPGRRAGCICARRPQFTGTTFPWTASLSQIPDSTYESTEAPIAQVETKYGVGFAAVPKVDFRMQHGKFEVSETKATMTALTKINRLPAAISSKGLR